MDGDDVIADAHTARRRLQRDGADHDGACAAAVRALVKTHKALKEDVSLATEVGKKRFPETEAGLIAQVVERDLPFYTAAITEDFVKGMNNFQKNVGLVTGDFSYEQVVATQFMSEWE